MANGRLSKFIDQEQKKIKNKKGVIRTEHVCLLWCSYSVKTQELCQLLSRHQDALLNGSVLPVPFSAARKTNYIQVTHKFARTIKFKTTELFYFLKGP